MASIRQARQRFLAAARREMKIALAAAAEILIEDQREKVSLTDHSLADLRRDGHPYRTEAPANQPHDDWLVHNQSGDLIAGLHKGELIETTSQLSIGLHSESQHTWYLILGTPRMRPRDFVSASLIDKEEELRRLFVAAHAQIHPEYHRSERDAVQIDLIDHGPYPAELPPRH